MICESMLKEVVWGISSELIVLYMKGTLEGSHLLSLGISEDWEGQSLLSQQGLKMSNHHKI